MRKFSDFKIESPSMAFTGDKIKIDRLLNREIIVHGYRIENSKFPEKGNDKCLYLQIAIGETKHIVFTIAKVLMENIQKIPKEGFPFKTTIIKMNERLEFS